MADELSKGERTRTTILAAAYELFVSSGYHAASMRLIAERAGLVVGGVYNHFSSKEEIFSAVVRTYHPFVTMAPQLHGASGQTAEEILRTTAQHLLAELDRQPGLTNLMFIEMVEFKGKHIPELVEALLPIVFGFLERLQAAPGRLRSLSPPVIFRIFIGNLFAHYLTMTLLNRAPLISGDLGSLDDALDIFLHGVMAAPTLDASTPPVLDKPSQPAAAALPASATPPAPAHAAPGPTWKGGRRTTPQGRT